MPSADELDRYIESAARLIDLPLAPEWIPAVRENLVVLLGHAARVSTIELPDDAEPAPVFRA